MKSDVATCVRQRECRRNFDGGRLTRSHLRIRCRTLQGESDGEFGEASRREEEPYRLVMEGG